MEIKYLVAGSWRAQAMLAFAFEGERPCIPEAVLKDVCPWLEKSPPLADFSGKINEVCVAYGEPDSAIPRIIMLGLGSREKMSLDVLRKAVATGAQKARGLGLRSLLLPEAAFADLPGGRARLLEESVCAIILGLYSFHQFKTTQENDPDALAELIIGLENESLLESAQIAARRGAVSGQAVCLGRDLDNTPGNRLYPEALALRASNLAEEHGFKCAVLDDNALREAGMGCMLAVGQGSTHPPRLIVLEYAPSGQEQEKPLLLVGKGITFDSGGICLKPAANMFQMKCDMSGAAAVLAVIDALAREGHHARVIALLACAENMPDGGAFRPGDVVESVNGDTVEIINTDAEGRLVLCDALAYAQKKWLPRAIVDIATLTGACAVALGNGLAGLFCDDDELCSRICGFGQAVGENFWRLPLWSPYEEELQSKIADISHTASREGGAITAALFLKHFVHPGQLWAHMDIAGVDWNAKANPLCPEGASGFGIRALLELCRGGIS